MSKIDELDNKYIVLKIKDLDEYIGNGLDRDLFESLCKKVNHLRETDGKSPNKYVVLNLEDEISLSYLNNEMTDMVHTRVMETVDSRTALKPAVVDDVAVILINSILKRQSQTTQIVDDHAQGE